MKMKIGEFLLLRLRQIGVRHVFGVPGDFNLQLLEQFGSVDGIEFIGTCNELNASYAADGYARVNGVGAVLTTYGVGDLSAICGLAGACAEHVPVVMISGAPPLYAIESRLRMHHTLGEGNFDNVRVCMHQFTCASVRLTPSNVASELDRVLLACRRDKLPVYIQVPSDITWLEVEVPDDELVFTMPSGDAERLASSVAGITALLDRAEYPLMLIDDDADRCGLAQDLFRIAKARNIPYLQCRTGKGIMPERDPLYMGIYNGDGSAPDVLEAMRRTDCLIATAPAFSEASAMASPNDLPAQADVYIRDGSVFVCGEPFEAVDSHELVSALAEKLCVGAPDTSDELPAPECPPAQEGKPLAQEWLWKRVQNFLKGDDLVCAENGTSLSALSGGRLPNGTAFIAQILWGAIGYALPALLGAMTADGKRRGVLFIGDGSLQLTVQELSTLLARGEKPVIFILNNGGYTIERYILGMDSAYNDIADWKYSRLPSVLAPDADVFCAEVSTEDGLEAALAEAGKGERAAVIELHLARDDAPGALKKFCAMTAELDYGPRGPQRMGR